MLNLVDHEKTSKEALIQEVVEKAYETLKIDSEKILNVILINDEKMKDFNTRFASKEVTTDVLSFPSGLETELGDIFISVDKAKSQALEYGHSLDREIGFLVVHGILHCVGYTHETEDDLETMIELQEKILHAVDLKR
jgi:probable rRNA maturation factor